MNPSAVELLGYAAAIGRRVCRRRNCLWLLDESESVAGLALAALLPTLTGATARGTVAREVGRAVDNWVRRELHRLDLVPLAAAPRAGSEDESPLEVDARDLYLRARQLMPPAAARVADAVYLRGLSVGDFARETGANHGTVSGHRSRAAAALRSVLP